MSNTVEKNFENSTFFDVISRITDETIKHMGCKSETVRKGDTKGHSAKK